MANEKEIYFVRSDYTRGTAPQDVVRYLEPASDHSYYGVIVGRDLFDADIVDIVNGKTHIRQNCQYCGSFGIDSKGHCESCGAPRYD